MKWVILGGGGQLGRAMSYELEKQGAEFISLTRNQLDITNQRDVNSFFIKELPHLVLNAAAWTNVDLAESHEEEAYLINAQGPKLLAGACAKIDAKFVHISTDYVFSGISHSPWHETTEVAPVSAYGRTKAAGESAVLGTYPSGSYVVRTAWLYSPWGKNFVKTLLRFALKETGNIEVVTSQIGQPTSAMDLASQIRLMAERNVPPGIYHGTNGGQTSWYELACKIFTLAGEDSNRVVAVNSSQNSRTAIRPDYSVLGHQKWLEAGITPMRDWQDSLSAVLPAILWDINQG